MDWRLAFVDTAWKLAGIVAIVAPLFVAVAYLTLWERKLIGWIQIRIGPNRVGPLGLLQPIADGVKLLFKEIILPTHASKGLFVLAPIMMLMPALAAWAVIPFAPELVLADINAGLLYVLALTSVGVYGVILAGWASNSKYAFLGAMRSAAQIVAYEIAMGFALVGVLMAGGSLNLGLRGLGWGGRTSFGIARIPLPRSVVPAVKAGGIVDQDGALKGEQHGKGRKRHDDAGRNEREGRQLLRESRDRREGRETGDLTKGHEGIGAPTFLYRQYVDGHAVDGDVLECGTRVDQESDCDHHR